MVVIPNVNFLFPCTMSFPAILTRENFNCFPILTTWLQFSTFLKGILIGGLVAIFQLTIPGDTLSSVCRSTHLQKIEVNFYFKFLIFTLSETVGSSTNIGSLPWYFFFLISIPQLHLPISKIFKDIIYHKRISKTVDPKAKCSLFSGHLSIIRSHFKKINLLCLC